VNMISLIFCCFCRRQHEYGRQFCKAVNMQCCSCGEKGHFSRMCQHKLKINIRNWLTPYENPKRNWKADFSFEYDFGKTQQFVKYLAIRPRESGRQADIP